MRHPQTSEDFLKDLAFYDSVRREGKGRLTFVRPIDLIVWGECSDPMMAKVTRRPPPTLECPMGKVYGSDESYLHAVVDQYRPKRVLVLPLCCGSYASSYGDLVRCAFPDIEWLFPEVPDFYDMGPSETVLEFLLKERFLQKV